MSDEPPTVLAAQPHGEPRQTPSGSLLQLNVLVVDDDVDNAAMLAEIIASRGHRVRVAHLGATCIELFQQEQATHVFLDVTLPDMSGYVVASTIRARFGDASRLAALTGLQGEHERSAARRAGCNAFIVKPCNLDQIFSFLQERDTENQLPVRCGTL